MRTARLLLWLAPLVAAACSTNSDDQGPRSSFTADQAAQARSACMFGQGTLPGLSLAKDAPLGKQIPIDTVVIVMMENRSFDHILGMLPAVGQTDADVAPADAMNLDQNGNPVKRFHQTDYCFNDTNHGFQGCHDQFDGGKNDGFVVTNAPPYDQEDHAPDGTRAMGYYDQNDVPWIYAAASTYAVADRYFASVMGPTFPNREYLYAATSYGHTGNDIFSCATCNQYNVMQLIEDYNAAHPMAPVSWHIYYEKIPGLGIFINTLTAHLDNVSLLNGSSGDPQAAPGSFFSDAQAGMLSNVNFIDPNLQDEWGGGDDFHPPGDMQRGDEFLSKIVAAAQASPQWPHMAVFITFDEHGGLYDHVPPPTACAPDDIAPIVGAGQNQYDFAQYGFRVPLIVVSPYAKPHYVSHVVYDHTSILRFVESRFQLPAMTKRDANADPLFDLFDFSKASFATPASLPTPTVDQAKLTDCENKYPLKSLDFGIPTDGGAPADGAEPLDGGTTD